MRWILAGLIVVLGGLSGVYASFLGKRRLYFWIELKRMVLLLRGEMRYGMYPIGEVCSHVADKMDGNRKKFLLELEDQIKKREEKDFSSIWEKSAGKWFPREYFQKGEWNQILQLGNMLGYLDLEMQMKGFSLILEQMDESIDRLKLQQEKNSRVYHTLGIGLGLMAAIVWI